MNVRRFAKDLKSNLYFASTPWINCLVNLYWHGRFTRRYVPKVLYLETTNLCNAHCVMCPHDSLSRPRGPMSWDLFARIIDQCAEFEGRGLKLFLHKDGEPLMDPMLFDRIAYARRKLPRSRIHFNTNAALLDDEKAGKILGSGLSSIVLSLDGASAATYEKIRVGLRYDAVRSNIESFLARKRAAGSPLHVILQMVAGKDNAHEAEAYRAQWTGKADQVVIKPMHNFLVQGTSVQGGEVGERQLARCTMPFHVMLVYRDGEVGLCCWDYDGIMKLGNVRDVALLDAFNNEPFALVRRAMRARDCKLLRPCNQCSQIYGHDGPLWV